MEKILEVKEISKKYQGEKGEVLAIDNVNFRVKRGEFISIIGPSGCGKSTLLSIIAGLEKKSKGEIYIEGERIEGISDKIGYMLQKDCLLEWRTIFSNCVFGLEVKGKINEENKNELTKWIYKIRYYRYIPINENECIKDIKELDEIFEKLIKQTIKKAQKIKLWDIFSEDFDLTYQILKEVFDTKIINLETINLSVKYENKVLYIEYYDDTVIESTKKIDIDNVRIKKKVKLFI